VADVTHRHDRTLRCLIAARAEPAAAQDLLDAQVQPSVPMSTLGRCRDGQHAELVMEQQRASHPPILLLDLV
jgi:hypothetical protein